MNEIANYIAGSEGEKVVDVIYRKKSVSEFLIAKKTNMTIHQTRNILYKLASRNIVSAIRKKGRKKGWFTTYYSLNIIKSLEEYKNLNLKKLQEIEGEIKSRQTTNLYSCSANCVVMKEEKALLHDFFCPECGQLMQPLNMENEIKKLNFEKEKILKNIKKVDTILTLEKEKIGRKRERKIEKERLEKKKAREKARVKAKKVERRKIRKLKVKKKTKGERKRKKRK